MNIYPGHKFNNILVISANTLNSSKNIKLDLIPKKWQLILMSDGSFTQNLNSLTGKYIYISILYKKTYILLNNKNLRSIYLTSGTNNKLTFARSIWVKHLNKSQQIIQKKIKPIGQSLIESRMDIYKDIHEIYYGYCNYLEKKFKSKGPVWGRKYTIYSQKASITTIQEFFSPQLINFF